VAGVDAVLVEGAGGPFVLGEELVAVVVEVADQGHVDAQVVEARADLGQRPRRGGVVHRHAHDLAAGARQLGDLRGGGGGVGGVGVGHRLHHHRVPAAEGHAADVGGGGRASEREL